MAIPNKVTSDFYSQSINTFCQPLAARANIAGAPCQWIQELDQQHEAISQQMREGIEAAHRTFAEHSKKMRIWMACLAGIGFGLGLGSFLGIVCGGGVLSIALGIIGGIGGIIAGVFLGLWSGKQEAFRKSQPAYQTVFSLEAHWIEGKMQELADLIQANGPDVAQLTLLQTHFQDILNQQAALTAKPRVKEWAQNLFKPAKGSQEDQVVQSWNNRNVTK
ncbi:MAG: hypothetical protein JSS32_10535 [Verrucomicrobia bacterium]|nr:hypothetical protein [Verrucomicrobiota bacterium]